MAERWVVLPEGATSDTQARYSQILAVHAALLPNGKVLFFGGSQHVYDNAPSINDPRLDNTRIWDPATGLVERIPSPNPLYDLFCCGHAFIYDGRLLLAGGTSGYIRHYQQANDSTRHTDHGHYRGSRRSTQFEFRAIATGPWRPTGELQVDATHTNAPDGRRNPDGTVGGGGRWYPTLVALGDRKIVAFGGHPQDLDRRHSNTSVEVFTPTQVGGSWVLVGEEPQDVQDAIRLERPVGADGRPDTAQPPNPQYMPEVYPRAHLLPNGRVFIACLADSYSYTWDPYQRASNRPGGWERLTRFLAGNTADRRAWDTTYFDNERQGYNRSYFAWSSVLLPLEPPHYEARVLIVGRRQPFVINLGRPSDQWPPANIRWQPTQPREDIHGLFMPSGERRASAPEREFPGRGDPAPGNPRHSNLPGARQQCFAVLLPDRSVLVLGGSTTHPSDWAGYYFDAVNATEVFDPNPAGARQWRTLSARQQVPRVYHGVAVLLADGRVWTAGSNPWGDGVAGLQPTGDWEHRIEVFEPWYFDRPRPTIKEAPERIRHGQVFELDTPDATRVHRVALLRVVSATHGQIFDQRYVGLEFSAAGPGRIRVVAPPDGFVAPPGYYLLHVVDQANVPSRGHFVRVELGWEPWFALTPNVFPPNSQLASVSVKEGHSSVYLVGLDNEGRNGGRIWAKAYPDSQTAGDWGPWQPIGDTTFRPGAPISVLGLRRGATALYAVGQDEGRGGGQVWTNVFPVDGNWGGWRPLGENVFPVGAPVTAVSSDTDATSLYIVGLDTENRGGGRVWTNAFPVNGTWSGWRPLGENIFPVGAPIAAVSLSRRATSLYLVGLDEDRGGGRVWTKFFPDPIRNNTWSDWSPLSEEVFPVGAPITVTSTTREGTSLFVVGLDNEGRGGGRVWTKAFPSSSDPNQWGPWRPIGENVFPPGAKVSTISHGPGRTSLYLIGITGQVWSTYFPSERGQWAPWFALGPNTFSRLGYLSVVSSVPGGTSLFALGTDSQVWSTYYDPP